MQTYVAGAAAATTLTAPLNNSTTTFSVVAATGWPANTPFVLALDRGTVNEEKILVTARAGTTVTACTRGYDGTSGVSHSVGTANVEHVLSAVQLQELIDHVNELAGGIDHTAAGLAANAVSTTKIVDLAVTTAKLNDLGVTTGKLADGAVTTAKITDANVTTTKLADANVTAAKLAAAIPLGTLGYAQAAVNQTGITTSVDATSLSTTVTVGSGRRIRITGHFYVSSTESGDSLGMGIMEGATQLQSAQIGAPTQNVLYTVHAEVILTPTAGSHTYKLTVSRAAGTGTVTLWAASPGYPAFILVEDIGV